MLVDFMMIGAQKCGTTSLAAQLAQHPGICFCSTKEPGFFHQHADWREQLSSYHALYAPKPGQLCGEASTMYTFLPEWRETHQRLFTYNPDLKLIYIMRNPVERVISNYTHDLVRNFVKAGPDTAVFQDPVYLNRSRYAVQMRPYRELFGAEKILLLIFEEYVRDQGRALEQVATFLGINPQPFAEMQAVHAHQSVGNYQLRSETARTVARSPLFRRLRAYVPAAVRQPIRRRFSQKLDVQPEFSSTLRREIWRFVEDDVAQIEAWLGRELTVWRQEYQ